MKQLTLAVAMACMAMTAPVGAATIVNLDGVTNASMDGANAVSVALGAGTYKLRFTKDKFEAFTRFSSVVGCNAAGGSCRQGFENSARYLIGESTFLFGDGAASGGLGPISGGGYFDTAARSFANSAAYSQMFKLAAPSNVKFFILDDFLSDNSGGISLSIAAVPEPATWAMMIIGFGTIGFAARRRRTAVHALTA